MTKAQDSFKSREGENSLDFNTWYILQDVEWLVWQAYEELDKAIKDQMHPPYVFFDGTIPDIESYIDICKQWLIKSKKDYLPIIFKPEIGAAHYMSAIIRKNPDESYTFFLFNPTGYHHESLTPKEYTKKRWDLKSDTVAGMNLVVSPHVVQQEKFEKELEDKKGTVLVSCGPISVDFIQYAMRHPEWVNSLDDSFKLPKSLTDLIGIEKSEYQEKIRALRRSHFEQLGRVKDDYFLEDKAANDFAEMSDLLLNTPRRPLILESDVTSDTDDILYYDEFGDPILDNSPAIEDLTGSYSGFGDDTGEDVETYEDYKEEENGQPDPVERNEYMNDNHTLSNSSVKLSTSSSTSSDILSHEASTLAEATKRYKDAIIKFESYVAQLKNLTSTLEEKGDKHSNLYNSQYVNVAIKAHQLQEDFETAKKAFANKLNHDGACEFKLACRDAIKTAKAEFANHRGFWHQLHPIIKGILGVLATITVIPAIVVEMTSKQGYVNTFFATPKTNSLVELETFETNIIKDVWEDLDNEAERQESPSL